MQTKVMELDGCLINQSNELQPADMTNIDLQLDPCSAGHNILYLTVRSKHYKHLKHRQQTLSK